MSSLPVVDVLNRSLLHTQVADRLRDLIVTGELEPGARLNERLLCERFNISRTPLREALKILSAEGLITLLPNRGAVVTKLTMEEAEDMFQVMAVLEGLAGELAGKRATDADIRKIRALHDDMQSHFEKGKLKQYFAANQKIHQCIVDAARNTELTNLYGKLSVRLRRARFVANISRERWQHAMQEHEEIMAALEQRDSDKLKAILRAHLENKFDAIRTSVAAKDDPDAGRNI